VRHETGLLANVGDLLAAKRGAPGAVERGQVDATHRHGAGVRQFEAGEQVQERRLPRPGRSGHRMQVAGRGTTRP